MFKGSLRLDLRDYKIVLGLQILINYFVRLKLEVHIVFYFGRRVIG